MALQLNEIRRILDAYAAQGPRNPEEEPANMMAVAMRNPDQGALLEGLAQPQISTSEQEAFAALPEDQRRTAKLPMGAFRNEQTGRVQYFGPDGPSDTPYGGQEQRQSATPTKVAMRVRGFGTDGMMSDLGTREASLPMLDYSRGEVEIPNVGKGRYGKDGKIYVKGPEGLEQIVLGYDRAASDAANDRALRRRAAEANIAQTEANIARDEEAITASQSARATREDTTTQAYLEKRFGKLPEGQRWTLDGKVVDIPGVNQAGKATEGERSAAGYALRMERAEKIMDEIGEKGFPNVGNVMAANLPYIGGQTLERISMTPEQQRYRQAQEDWVRAKLRKESGAVIGKEEMDKEISVYFPQIFDKSVDQKRQSRLSAMDQMRVGAGRAYQPQEDRPQEQPKPSSRFKALPDPKQFQGRRVRGDDGTIYRSNGASWVKE